MATRKVHGTIAGPAGPWQRIKKTSTGTACGRRSSTISNRHSQYTARLEKIKRRGSKNGEKQYKVWKEERRSLSIVTGDQLRSSSSEGQDTNRTVCRQTTPKNTSTIQSIVPQATKRSVVVTALMGVDEQDGIVCRSDEEIGLLGVGHEDHVIRLVLPCLSPGLQVGGKE